MSLTASASDTWMTSSPKAQALTKHWHHQQPVHNLVEVYTVEVGKLQIKPVTQVQDTLAEASKAVLVATVNFKAIRQLRAYL